MRLCGKTARWLSSTRQYSTVTRYAAGKGGGRGGGVEVSQYKSDSYPMSSVGEFERLMLTLILNLLE